MPMHVVVRGNDRQPIFRTEGDRVFFHRCLIDATRRCSVSVHAYVFMTNHIHLLASGAHERSISEAIQRVGRHYVPYFNSLHGRTGGLWEGRFRSCAVDTEQYFFACQRYIELNPVRGGIVATAAQFAWSSHRHFAFGSPDDLITLHEVQKAMGDEASYRALFQELLPAEVLSRIRDSVHKGWALGGPDFCAQLEDLAARRVNKATRGRPSRRA